MPVIRSGRRRVSGAPTEIVWKYDPLPRQMEFHECTTRYKLYGGAMGGGKTVALCAEAVRLSIEFPGNRIYLCRHLMADFVRTTLVTFERICPGELIRQHYKADRLIALRNNSEILYGGLGGEEDLERIKSAEFGAFGIDEITETYLDMWNLLCSRLRWQLPDGRRPRYHGFAASNPEPGWVKDKFVDRQIEGHKFIPALPKDNPFLPEDYYASLRRDFPEEWVRRYLDGSWDVFEGQIYKEFDRAAHVYNDLEPGVGWQKIRVIDHGYTNPTACLFCYIDHDGNILIDDEHYERHMLIDEHANIIRTKHPEFNAALTLCDPSMFNKASERQGKPWSYADEYRTHGIICVSPYSSDGYVQEGVGINQVKQRLKAKSLRINARCVNTISEMVGYKWKDLKGGAKGEKNQLEVPVDKDNHALDCIRYLCAWRPPPAPKLQSPDPQGNKFVEIEKWKRKKQAQESEYAGWN